MRSFDGVTWRPTAVLIALAAVLLLLLWPFPLVVILAVVVPALLLVLLLRYLAGEDRESLVITLATILAGAVVAGVPAAYFNQWLADGLSRYDLTTAWSAAALIAPAVEELAKALLIVAIWCLMPMPAHVRSAVFRGAYVGLGFTMIENTQYLLLAVIQGGLQQLPLAIYLRWVVGGWHHALFAASTAAGLALGASASGKRAWRMPLLALAWAIAQHVAWNALAAPLLTSELCGAAASNGACRTVPYALDLVLTAPLIVLAALAPGGLVLWRVCRRPRG